ncbi:hypothetical protein SAMD00023353_3200080 [Rosellinia necatrix]|uniref:Rhodopsin domain-containing protein n=1 Tax=Rosellinia necatrix TaxID=77044 RepID=A0A1W2TIH7_ROSNE|nr:hypothetical protein SAMD00023353_3200080 [Rosellinia necatrix]
MELATFSTAIKYFTIGSWLFTVLAANIRLTFLFLYLRLFGQNKKLRYVAYGGIVFVIAINLVILLSLIFRCNPVRKSWDITAPGTCVHSAIIPYLSAVASPVTDLFVFLLPLPIIVHLNMDNRKRLKLLAVFGIGLLSCIASLIRLGETPSLYASLDYTWQLSDLILWGTIEVDVGISCTCLILLPAFVEHYSKGSSHPYKTPSWISSILLIPLRNRGSDANLKADCHKVPVDEADVSNSRPQSKPSSETLQPTEAMK